MLQVKRLGRSFEHCSTPLFGWLTQRTPKQKAPKKKHPVQGARFCRWGEGRSFSEGAGGEGANGNKPRRRPTTTSDGQAPAATGGLWLTIMGTRTLQLFAAMLSDLSLRRPLYHLPESPHAPLLLERAEYSASAASMTAPADRREPGLTRFGPDGRG